ncbi:MAG: hypothetical protein NT029_07960 [Armatimonadetes bacterium]|nr:hypothetical protein [Armatimonadota bacterium]
MFHTIIGLLASAWVGAGLAPHSLSRTAPMPAEASVVRCDFGKPAGRFRALHGINKGPLIAGGMLDIANDQLELKPPFSRLHDCHWPNPDVVDIHAIFPNPDADPDDPANYTFELTDAYVAAVRATGARVIYRLGESIEHTAIKRWVNPPKDAGRWARVALGVVRHYNDGWANGHRWDIRHWEIWNEPENRPACWTGSDRQFFELYTAAAKAIKARFPRVEVGGPGFGYTGAVTGADFAPGDCLTAFLSHCRAHAAPLDFLSWHCYTNDPAELPIRARGVRRALDEAGFAKAETHLTEWNYLPNGSWDGFGKTSTPEARRAFVANMAGPRGAAFTAAALIILQDAAVDVSCFYHGEVGAWGILSAEGVRERNYWALLGSRRLCETPRRAAVETPSPKVTAAAGLSEDGGSATVMVSHRGEGRIELDLRIKGLPWAAGGVCTVRVVDASRDGGVEQPGPPIGPDGAIRLDLQGQGIVLIRLKRAN